MCEVPFIGGVIRPARTVGGGAGRDASVTAPQHCR